MRKWIPFLMVLILVAGFALTAEAQCSMCSAVVSSSLEDEASQTGRGINKAILFLMGFPYLLLMGFLYVFYRERILGFFRSFSKKV